MPDSTPPPEFKPKKSVALSGVVAGNTAICTVGRTGNDLHYRGYDITDVATHATYEEVAYLLIHEHLPNATELHAYREKLKKLRGLPVPLRAVLEQIPAAAHPMHVLRTGCSMLGNLEHEKLPSAGAGPASAAGARDLADRLLACFPSMLLYWHHFTRHGKRIMVDTADDSIAAHFLHLLHQRAPTGSHVRALDRSLILYAEHEFNASTFTARVIAGTATDFHSAITGAIGALRGPKHGGANEVAYEIQQRYRTPDQAEADIRAILGLDYAYDDPGVGTFGLKNAVFPVGETFLEVVSPKQAGTTAGRLLEKRGGDGGYMAIFQVRDIKAARARIEAAGARTVANADRDGVHMTHIHPKDIGGAIVSVDQMEPWERWEWGGPVWRDNVRTDTSAAITGAEIQGDDPEALAKRWGEILGFAPVKTGGGWKIDLDDGGEIRFVVAVDGRGEGLGRFDVAVKDPEAVRAAAKARGKLGEDGDVILSGTRVRLVQA